MSIPFVYSPRPISAGSIQFLAGRNLDDIVALIVIAIASSLYVTRGFLWAKQEPGYHRFFQPPQGKAAAPPSDSHVRGTRNISERMKELVSCPSFDKYILRYSRILCPRTRMW
jgi:hypothetical protein